MYPKTKHRYAKAKAGYEGTRIWAERHAARLQSLVGTVENDHLIVTVEAKPYAHSTHKWGVVTYWEYPGKPELGRFKSGYVWLPYD
jgi:hypothetical protein